MTEEKNNESIEVEVSNSEINLEPDFEEATKVEESLKSESEDNQSETVEEVVEEDPLTVLQSEKDALEERVLRLQAEIANMQRINTKERQDSAKYRSQKLATEMLDVIDNLDRALDTPTTSEDANALKKGVEMVVAQVKNAFERENITMIDPVGEKFDPNFHQAVSVMPGEEGQESDTVINVLQKGYLLHDRVLRPAMVIVSE